MESKFNQFLSDIFYKEGFVGARWRNAVGAKIEGILGVNRVVIEERSQIRKKVLKLDNVFEVDPLGVPTSPWIPPIPPYCHRHTQQLGV